MLKQQLSRSQCSGAHPSARTHPVAAAVQCRAQHSQNVEPAQRAFTAAPFLVASLVASQALFPISPARAEMMVSAPEPASASYAYTDEEDVRRQVRMH
jgi:hypothetical protein